MSDAMLADETCVIPHSSVAMATLEPFIWINGRGYEQYKPRDAHPSGPSRSRQIFLPIPSLRYDMRIATALERLTLTPCSGSITTLCINLLGAACTYDLLNQILTGERFRVTIYHRWRGAWMK